MNKPVFYIILFLGLAFKSLAQENLIYNGDFELYDTCPTSVSTVGDYQIEHCLGWYSPSIATSDYFNSCANWPVSIPNNINGKRNPFSGNAYCGVLIENCQYPSHCVGWWIEYLQSKLKEPLKKGHEYEFVCRVALTNLLNEYAFAKFGAYFSSNPISRLDSKPFQVIPQILNSKNNFISDTTDWTEIKGSFVANGGEEFITLGFFIDTNNLDTLRFTTFEIDSNNYGSYYFIDNASLNEKIEFNEFPNIFTPNGDGVNDFWKPLGQYGNVIILNRWGNVVFEFTNSQNWNGKTANGILCPDGIYYYRVMDINNLIKTGFIQLVR